MPRKLTCAKTKCLPKNSFTIPINNSFVFILPLRIKRSAWERTKAMVCCLSKLTVWGLVGRFWKVINTSPLTVFFRFSCLGEKVFCVNQSHRTKKKPLSKHALLRAYHSTPEMEWKVMLKKPSCFNTRYTCKMAR